MRIAAPMARLWDDWISNGEDNRDRRIGEYGSHPSAWFMGTMACKGASEEPSPSATKDRDFMARTERTKPLTTTSWASWSPSWGFHPKNFAMDRRDSSSVDMYRRRDGN